MKKFFKFYFYFLVAMLFFGFVLKMTDPLDGEVKIANQNLKAQQKKQESNEDTKKLARVLYIRMKMDFLLKATKEIVVTKHHLEIYEKNVQKLYKALDENKGDIEFNTKIKKLIDERLTKIKQHHKRYNEILSLIKNSQLDDAIKLVGLKTPQEFLVAVMKENATKLTLELIDKVDLSENKYKKDETPILLASKMYEQTKVLDKLLSKTFSLTNLKSMKILRDLLIGYSEQFCISDEDFKRGKNIAEFLDKYDKTDGLIIFRINTNAYSKRVEKLYNKEIDLAKYNLKFLYERAIKHGCNRLFIKLINDDKAMHLKNSTITVKEPLQLARGKRYVDNKYTLFEYAQKYDRVEMMKQLRGI